MRRRLIRQEQNNMWLQRGPNNAAASQNIGPKKDIFVKQPAIKWLMFIFYLLACPVCIYFRMYGQYSVFAADLALTELLESGPIKLDFKVVFPFACLLVTVAIAKMYFIVKMFAQ